MNKKEVAEVLEEIAVLLELQGENPFRIRAYRNAARMLLNQDESLSSLISQDKLSSLPGIGEDLAEKITLLATKGRLPFYEKLKKSIPQGLRELMQIPGLGGKRIKVLYEKLNITSLKDLKEACEKGKIACLPRFGEKTAQNILNALEHQKIYGKRLLWWEAMEIAIPLLEELRAQKGVKRAEAAGSLRRKLETIGDLDFVVSSTSPASLIRWFSTHPSVKQVLGKGETKVSVRLKGGMQVDLRIIPEKQFYFTLHHFTGSKEHNIALRDRALKRGWSLSEYGLISETRKKSPLEGIRKTPTERDIFKALGLNYIPPELRENTGEIEAAEKGKLPTLVEEKDIRGTLHNHTTASDGRNTLKEMVQAAEKLQWEYIGIADHSKSSFQANGQKAEQLLSQVEEIRKLNSSKKGRVHIFAGVECDILPNGRLDFSDDILKHLDYVVVSIHSSLQQDEKTMTERIIKAIENPYSTMVGHVTGRLLLRREPYKVDVSKVIDACIANGKIMELNSNPMRLDMDWRLWHAAKDKGLMCCINTDAHSVDNLQFFRAGVNVARKGWLEKKDILNTYPLTAVQKMLKT